jgi:hypothetical protein
MKIGLRFLIHLLVLDSDEEASEFQMCLAMSAGECTVSSSLVVSYEVVVFDGDIMLYYGIIRYGVRCIEVYGMMSRCM